MDSFPVRCLIALSVIGIFICTFKGIIKVAERNPHLALMEGAELSQFKQAELASKYTQTPPDTPPVSHSQVGLTSEEGESND